MLCHANPKNRYCAYIKHTTPSTLQSSAPSSATRSSKQTVSLHSASPPIERWINGRFRHAHLRKVSPSLCDASSAYFAQRAVFLLDVKSFWTLSTPRSRVPSAISGHAVTSSLVLSGRQLGSLGHPGGSGYVIAQVSVRSFGLSNQPMLVEHSVTCVS